jgi:hypothetical protein
VLPSPYRAIYKHLGFVRVDVKAVVEDFYLYAESLMGGVYHEDYDYFDVSCFDALGE